MAREEDGGEGCGGRREERKCQKFFEMAAWGRGGSYNPTQADSDSGAMADGALLHSDPQGRAKDWVGLEGAYRRTKDRLWGGLGDCS